MAWKVARFPVGVAIYLAATPSSFAACSQSRSDVDAALKYLSCLNNEQADAINRHADAINNLMDAVKTLEGNEQKLARKIDELALDVQTLRRKVDELESRR